MSKSDPAIRQAVLEVLAGGAVKGTSMCQLRDECGLQGESVNAFKRAVGSLVHTGQVTLNHPLPSGPSDAGDRMFTLQLVQ